MPLREKMLTVNGRAVHVWQQNDQNGKAVILLHGGFGDAWTNWKEIIPVLAEEDYHVIAPDLPGYGQSAAMPDMRLGALIEWLQALMETLEVKHAVLIGHSFGSLLARLFAAAHPRHTPAVVLINGGVLPDVPATARLIARIPVLGPMLFKRISDNTATRPYTSEAAHVKEALSENFFANINLNRPGLAALMRGLTLSSVPKAHVPPVPVLLLWGEADTITPLNAAEYVKNEIAGSKLTTIADCGHFPHLEAPEVFTRQVVFYLSKLDRGAERGPGAGMLG
jgi:pimeloyl-ACP methyl ester carboxylesterase